MSNYADRQFVCMHALETLPDSVMARRRLLRGVQDILKEFDPVRIAAKRMLVHMDAIDREQKQLPFSISGNGDGDGQAKKGGSK